MITLDTSQQSIVDSDYKEVTWLFDVITSGGLYHWSTKVKSDVGEIRWATDIDWATGIEWDTGIDYTFKIDKTFQDVRLTKPQYESGIQAYNDTVFTIPNDSNTMIPSDFTDGTVMISLLCSDGTIERTIRKWKMAISRCEAGQQKLTFTCESFLQPYLQGDYPNTPYLESIGQSDVMAMFEDEHVSQPFGTCYIPLKSIYIVDQRYYLLGSADYDYTINKVRSPRGRNISTWESASYDFNQYTKTIDATNWRVFQPIIADSDYDGVADANGLWLEGDHFLDILAEFSRSDTVSKTNPADVIKFMLEDIGVDPTDIDTTTFNAANATYAGWGLSFEGAFGIGKPRDKALSELLLSCHSMLVIEDKIQLHVLSKTSQKTITDALITHPNEQAPTSFRHSLITQTKNDSGNISYVDTGEPQDILIKATVPAKATTDNISNDNINFPFVDDSQNAQRLGTLFYQRKYLPKERGNFSAKGKLLGLTPGDIITISDADYGGTYSVLITGMQISRSLEVVINFVSFSDDLDDWGDLAPGAIIVATDDSTNMWTRIIAGPDGGNQNIITEKIVISTGGKLIIDGGEISFKGAETITIGNEGLHILDTDESHDLIIKPGSDLSADRILNIMTGDAARTVTLNGNTTLNDWFDQSVKIAATPTLGGLIIADGGTIGQAAGPLLTFDDTDNYLEIMGCNVGIGIASPDTKLQVIGDTKLGDNNTNYATFASDGEMTLIGTARVKKQVWIGANGIKAPSANPASWVLHGIKGAWQFADAIEANQESVSGTIKIPTDMDIAEIPTFNIGWSADEVSPGDCEWQFEYLWLTGNEDTSAVAQETLTVTSTASATSNGMIVVAVSGIDLPDVADNAMFWKITRLSAHANDTIADTVEMHGNYFEYTANKLGTTT